MSEHEHYWKRLPIVSLSVTYQCGGCGTAIVVIWTSMMPQTLEVLDAEVVKDHGGTFAGEMYPQPTPEQIKQKYLEITGYGR